MQPENKCMAEQEVLLLWSFPGNALSLVLLVRSDWWWGFGKWKFKVLESGCLITQQRKEAAKFMIMGWILKLVTAGKAGIFRYNNQDRESFRYAYNDASTAEQYLLEKSTDRCLTFYKSIIFLQDAFSPKTLLFMGKSFQDPTVTPAALRPNHHSLP